MSVHIAEYLGHRTDSNEPIQKVNYNEKPKCPFMESTCDKVARKNKPICTVKKLDGTAWIVCENRLCATKGTIGNHQKEILHQVAKEIFHPEADKSSVYISKEVGIPNQDHQSTCDYVMVYTGDTRIQDTPKRVILEMQGGGETSNTGLITRLVERWENNDLRTNNYLSQQISGTGTLQTNAWRRQQEQFLLKGRVATLSTGAIVFAVGTLLYNLIQNKIGGRNLTDVTDGSWSLAILCFDETPSSNNHLNFSINSKKSIFTEYASFVNILTDQGRPATEIFRGKFQNLNGELIQL